MGWVSPTSHDDVSEGWSNETDAYDENTGTFALCAIHYSVGYSGFLELILSSPINSNKLRFWVSNQVDWIDVDVYDSDTSQWINVYEDNNPPPLGEWVEKTFTQRNISKGRIRFGTDIPGGPYYPWLNEWDFWEILAVEHEVTIIESIGMSDSVAKQFSAKKTVSDLLGMVDGVAKQFSAKKTVSDSIGMLETVTKQFDARKTITDSIGLLDTAPTKAAFRQLISDKIGMTDSVTRQKSMFQTISDILGLADIIGTKAAFKQAVTDIIGMLDSAARSIGFSITISEILGIRDRLVTRKRTWPLRDLPDDTIQGGA